MGINLKEEIIYLGERLGDLLDLKTQIEILRRDAWIVENYPNCHYVELNGGPINKQIADELIKRRKLGDKFAVDFGCVVPSGNWNPYNKNATWNPPKKPAYKMGIITTDDIKITDGPIQDDLQELIERRNVFWYLSGEKTVKTINEYNERIKQEEELAKMMEEPSKENEEVIDQQKNK